jgi:protoporphyrinogen/coproporphyrinogen III oxidase
VASAPLTIVVGAGISGLTCAFTLKKSGQNVLLLEASARPGGVIQSIQENGYLFEQGPQSFSSTAALAELCDDLLLSEEVVAAPHRAPRYVLIDRKLVRVLMSPALLVSGLLSWSTKFSFLRDALGKTSPPETEESIAAFVRRKFSAELLDRLVGPFVSGVYAGDPEQLSLRGAFPKLYEAEKAAGSVVRGAFKLGKPEGQKTVTRPRPRPGLLSFRKGNETLPRALAANLGASLRCNATVAELKRATGSFQLRIRTAEGEEELFCTRLVVATPTATAAELLSNVAPSACGALQEISYAPVAVVSLAYRTDQIRHSMEGFGFLVPRSAKIRTLGTVWNSSLFPGRAPQGQVLLTSFIGGATDPAATSLPAEELAATVHREISPLLRITGEPVASRLTRYARAIPQYNLGHRDRLKSILDAVGAVPGLWMTGNYWQGPAIGACVEHALIVAEQVRIS